MIRHSRRQNLFVAQCDHGIDLRCPTCGNVGTGQQNATDEHHSRNQSQRVRWFDAEESCFDGPACGEPHRDTQADANRQEREGLPQYHPKELGFGSSERYPNAELARAAHHVVRHHSVESDARQGERQQREEAFQFRDEPLLIDEVIYLFVDSLGFIIRTGRFGSMSASAARTSAVIFTGSPTLLICSQ
jgi:hypothetical protein